MAKLDETSIINPIDELPHHHPNLSKIEDDDDDGIPTINLAPIISLDKMPNTNADITDPNIHAIIAQIGRACEKWGAFQVVNHGVPLENLSKLELAGRKFFGQSEEEKRKVSRSMMQPLGYFDDEYVITVRDWKEVFEFAAPETTFGPLMSSEPVQLFNRWPQYPPELRDVAQESVPDMKKLGVTVMELIALSLDLAANQLTNSHKDPSLLVRLTRYPTSQEPVIGIGSHKDSETITIISEDDAGGLQVQRKLDGEWISVKPSPGAFVVVVGDLMEAWSNDKYESVVHRVMLNTKKERFSIGYFFGPAYSVNVNPMEELIQQQKPAKYKEFNYGAYRASVIKSYVRKPNIGAQRVFDFKIIT